MTAMKLIVGGIGEVRLTDAMSRALIVVGVHDRHAKVSNVTDERRGLVYWQAARSLETAGLVECCGRDERMADLLDVTPAGRRLYYALQARPAEAQRG